MPLRTLLVIAAINVLPLAAEAQCLPGEPIAECLTRALQAPDSLLPPTVSAPDASGGDRATRNALILSLQNQVQELTATLVRLIAERTQQPDNALAPAVPSTPSSAPVPVITRNLARGDRGEDVRQLQTFFIASGLLAADSATGYFGPLTEQAVQQWQAKSNIVSSGSPATTGFGAVGPRTRAAFSIGSAGFASTSTSGAGVAAPISSASPTASNQTSPQTGGSGGSGGGGGGTASAPTACAFNGQTVAHGASVTAYLAASVPSGSTCTSQLRVCSNGVLSGTYTAASCTVGTASACTWNGQSVANGQSVTAYQNATVPSGSQCVSEQRACNNGTLSGTYQSSTCSVQASAACSLNGVAVAHGQSATFYSASSVPFGSTCSSVAQTRTCTNGTLGGGASFNQASCTVADALPTPTPAAPKLFPVRNNLSSPHSMLTSRRSAMRIPSKAIDKWHGELRYNRRRVRLGTDDEPSDMERMDGDAHAHDDFYRNVHVEFRDDTRIIGHDHGSWLHSVEGVLVQFTDRRARRVHYRIHLADSTVGFDVRCHFAGTHL